MIEEENMGHESYRPEYEGDEGQDCYKYRCRWFRFLLMLTFIIIIPLLIAIGTIASRQ